MSNRKHVACCSPPSHKPKFSAEKKTDITSMLKFLPTVDSEFMKALLGNDSKNRMLQEMQE